VPGIDIEIGLDVLLTLQAASVDTAQSFAWSFRGYCGFHWTTLLLMFMFIFIFTFKGVNSEDIKDQISNRSFHHFGPNVEITDQSIVVPSFSTRILSLSL
jgi:hypothetical protein